jgi:acyl-CoA thioesterase FadM
VENRRFYVHAHLVRIVPAFVLPIAIRFRDIDALDHVNHAVVLTFAETIRCDWFAQVAGYPSMANLPFIIASAHVEYKAPIAKTDPVEILGLRLRGAQHQDAAGVCHGEDRPGGIRLQGGQDH